MSRIFYDVIMAFEQYKRVEQLQGKDVWKIDPGRPVFPYETQQLYFVEKKVELLFEQPYIDEETRNTPIDPQYINNFVAEHCPDIVVARRVFELQEKVANGGRIPDLHMLSNEEIIDALSHLVVTVGFDADKHDGNSRWETPRGTKVVSRLDVTLLFPHINAKRLEDLPYYSITFSEHKNRVRKLANMISILHYLKITHRDIASKNIVVSHLDPEEIGMIDFEFANLDDKVDPYQDLLAYLLLIDDPFDRSVSIDPEMLQKPNFYTQRTTDLIKNLDKRNKNWDPQTARYLYDSIFNN
jgi:hypothetical protein